MAWLALSGALAGCLGGGSGAELATPSEAAAASPDAGAADLLANRTWLLEEQLAAAPYDLNATRDDWFVTVGASGPERNVTAFSWVVPEGALVRRTPSGFFGTGLFAGAARDMLILELAPVILQKDAADSVEMWCLIAFRLDEGKAAYQGNVCDGRWYETIATGPARDENFYPASGLLPKRLQMSTGEIRAGDTMHFVLLVDATEPSEFGVALRAVHDPADTQMSRDFESFRSKVASQGPRSLPRVGEAAGFSLPFYGYYMSPILVAFGGGLTYEGWTDMITVRDALPDVRASAAVRDATLSYEFPVERGFTLSYAAVGYFTPTGQFSYSYDYHGTAASGDIVVAAGASAASVWAGGAGWVVVAEGEGGAQARLRFAGADPGALHGLELYDIVVAATVQDLVGVPLEPFVETWGLPGSQPPLLAASFGRPMRSAWE